jgi:hypothetical protein
MHHGPPPSLSNKDTRFLGVEGCLPSKREALSSNPTTTTTKKDSKFFPELYSWH